MLAPVPFLTVQVLVASITSLLKTVKSVEDSAARGLRALESAIEAIDFELQQYVLPGRHVSHPRRQPAAAESTTTTTGPEDLIRSTRPIMTSTAKLMGAITSGAPLLLAS